MKTIGYSFSHVRSLMNRYRDDPTTEVCVWWSTARLEKCFLLSPNTREGDSVFR